MEKVHPSQLEVIIVEKTNFAGGDCYRIQTDLKQDLKGVYMYDSEPEEVAHWVKLANAWQVVTRDKKALCTIKVGEIVYSRGYLYGRKQALQKYSENWTVDAAIQPIIETICGLVKNGVLTLEQGRERLLRHLSLEQTEQFLKSS